MGFKCGIIGLPNVGKSTLFNVLTKGNSTVANFPFCTIKPNTGIALVDDVRISTLAKIVRPKNIVHTFIEFVDIAGLVKGASKGDGLGNQFLNNIKNTHAIAHVVRCFKDDNITHIYNNVDPVRDINIVNSELILSDFETCEKAMLKLKKKNTSLMFDYKVISKILKKCMNHLTHFMMLKTLNLTLNEKISIQYLNLLTLKPMMYIANINEDKQSKQFLNQLCCEAQKEYSKVIPILVNLELDLISMNSHEQKTFMNIFNIQRLGINNIVAEGYRLLNLITFFTVGIKEIHAWSIPYGSTSIQAAKKIHSDFSKGFIRVQIVSYVDFIKYKYESKIKEAGKFRTEGKNYQIQDGDIVHFLFNV